MSLSELGILSPNLALAGVTLVGLLLFGGIGVILLGNGLRTRYQNPELAEKEIWESCKFLVTALLFLTLGSPTVFILIGLLVAQVFLKKSSKRSR